MKLVQNGTKQSVVSTCLWDYTSIVVQLFFLGILMLQFIRSRCRVPNKSAKTYNIQAKVGLPYKTSIICSVLLMVTHIMMLITVAFISPEVVLQLVSWAINLLVLYNIWSKRYPNFPWIMRAWWVSSFVLSISQAIIVLMDNDHLLRMQDIAYLCNVLASGCLFVISIQGNTRIASSDDEMITDPLLEMNSGANMDESPYGKASFFQLITFSWLNPLFEIGIKKPLDQDEVPHVHINDSASFVSRSFDECLIINGTPTRNSIYKAIYVFARKKAAINAVFAVISAVASYVGPYLIDDFVSFLSEKKGRSLASGYMLIFAFLGAKMIETITQRQWIFGARQLGLRLRSAMISRIYQKGLVLSSKSRQTQTSGEIINYMGVDVQRLADFMWYLNIIWMLPIQIFLAVYILYENLGLGSLFGLSATMIVMAGNIPLTRISKIYQTKIMDMKDKRMKATSEVLRSIKIIKLQAWDNHYLEKLERIRKLEYHWLFKSLRLSAITGVIYWASPSFISIATFGGCVLMGVPLTAGRVLSALATFQMLQDPLTNLPELLTVIVQGKVSADRISSFLQEGEVQSNAVESFPCNEIEFEIEINNGTFTWDDDDDEASLPTLEDINIQIKPKMKVAICGTVGSGKSSLLSCILGEMPKVSGKVKINGGSRKAYVPQSPWILSGNVRDNIVFGKDYDIREYKRTVEACALMKDFELFPARDLTEIGERGINMSGGQKQRIQLARAVYQDADIYLLDDPFSAVDAHTGTKLFQECLMRILKDKTVLYVTHQMEFLPAADLILVMKNGRIAQAGTFEELLKQNIGFEILVGAHNQALESVLKVEKSSITREEESEPNTEQNVDNVEITEKEGRLVKDEEREKGSIGKDIYWNYLTIVKGGVFVPIIILGHSFYMVLQIWSNYWMASACSNNEFSMNYVMMVYILLALVSSIALLIRSFLVAISGLWTAQKLFSEMLHSVLRAPMSFFDSTPTGRILNRTSTDQSVVDLDLATKLGWCAFSMIQLLGIIVVMSRVAWEVFVIFIPVTGVCIWYQRYYTPTARELARLAGIERSPILHHFAESLSGAATIRAFNHNNRFIQQNLELIDNHSRPWFHNLSAMEWLSFRLNQLSNVVFAFSLILLVTLPQGIIDPSVAGMAITYGMSLNVQLAYVIWNICSADNKMISVERILQYSNLQSEEASPVIRNHTPPQNWPLLGTISFTNLQIRYAEHLPCVLKGITCTFPGRHKVGVVGRTGSGKSTLIHAIFRVVEPTQGTIVIDGIDITKIRLHELRSRLSIIPQDPTMFEGTIRGNFDPLCKYSDSQIWEALDKCQLGDLVRSRPEKLDSIVVENGENWSVGQRQLLCLGRALLKKSSILVLDEATASVDSTTDGIIQKIISQEFKDRTIVTVAHRIHTIIDSDFVLVLSDGKIAEYDSPSKLLETQYSYFSQLITEYSRKSQTGNQAQEN